jgi:hypothetical protein
MRAPRASIQTGRRPVLSWGHLPHNPRIEARVAAEARKIQDVDRRILCKVVLDEVHGIGRGTARCSAEVVLVRPRGDPIIAREESSQGIRTARLGRALTTAFATARRRLLRSRARRRRRRRSGRARPGP